MIVQIIPVLTIFMVGVDYRAQSIVELQLIMVCAMVAVVVLL